MSQNHIVINRLHPILHGKKYHYVFTNLPKNSFLLQMVILPLIVSSLITGMSSLPSKAAGKLGLLTVAYYMTTTLIAVIMGLIFVLTIQPGHRGETITVGQDKHTLSDPVDTMLDLVRCVNIHSQQCAWWCLSTVILGGCYIAVVTKFESHYLNMEQVQTLLYILLWLVVTASDQWAWLTSACQPYLHAVLYVKEFHNFDVYIRIFLYFFFIKFCIIK